MIESYNFGKIAIDGRHYTTDVIIFPDHVQDGWRRKEGHRLSIEDLKDVIEARPETLIVGTGFFGSMKVPNEVREYFASMKIELVVEDTRKACETYNRMASLKKVAAAFHLTC
jgi:hypothetical protein